MMKQWLKGGNIHKSQAHLHLELKRRANLRFQEALIALAQSNVALDR